MSRAGQERRPELLALTSALDREIDFGRWALRNIPYRSRRKEFSSLNRHQYGRYEVLHKLGQGSMSAVYLARDPYLSRLVAVKVLHANHLYEKEILERFFREAKIVSRIQSAHIVSVFDVGMEDRIPFLVMEFIDGQNLQKILDQMQGHPMDPVVACALAAQVLDGISAASDWGIVHRDLKPENLMLTQKGHLKVADFGICHLKEHTMTLTGQVFGSPRFMSPEQVKGIKPISIQSDLFSVGAVLYYMLSGAPPFMAESLPDLYRQIASEPHVSLLDVRPGLDKGLVRLVDGLLDKDPAKRGKSPSTVAMVLKVLDEKEDIRAH
jgi:eukaryotic-like serine/threonine-protein kinase